MKQHFSRIERRNQRGVALIIVLGFLGLMVMMAVSFMIQARVERMVADSTLEGIRARQVVQTGVAVAIQDYMNAVMSLDGGQNNPLLDMFISGDYRKVAHYSGEGYEYSGLKYGSTNLWNGEARYWLPSGVTNNPSIDKDDIEEMEWIWVRQDPQKSTSPILGRYAYACFKLSGCVDANLLGRDLPDDNRGHGTQTNRNNVRKLFADNLKLSSGKVQTTDDSHGKLITYQEMWQGFDTPATLELLTDGKYKDGKQKGEDENRWRLYVGHENDVKDLNTDFLSCYSYAALHRGSDDYRKEKCTAENIKKSTWLKKLVTEMGGDLSDVEKAIDDYTSSKPTPIGTNYPSVKAVPMFNEIMAQVELKQADGSGKWQLEVTLKPEFWYPFRSKDNDKGYRYSLPAPTVSCGTAQTGDADVLVRAIGFVDGKPRQDVTFNEVSSPTTPLDVDAKYSDNKPYSPGEFKYVFDIVVPDNEGSTPTLDRVGIPTIILQRAWNLLYNGTSVDATPDEAITFRFMSPNNVLTPGGTTKLVRYLEASDPRLNHISPTKGDIWQISDKGSMGELNSNLAAAQREAATAMGYEPGADLYCRNGDLQSPAELGYIPIFSSTRKTPWMTLDIFSENGIEMMNTLVCNERDGNWGTWNVMEDYDVFYTNGTINPYTLYTNVFCAAFYGLDLREVPNIAGDAANSQLFGPEHGIVPFAQQLVKTNLPSGKSFTKDGPAGWARLLSCVDKDVFNGQNYHLNKNERLSLVHNTWGLFNESDFPFLVFVVAQSISEAPAAEDSKGHWNENADMITGERWAVALCWMDTRRNEDVDSGTSDDGAQLNREMDIIMFKYLNE